MISNNNPSPRPIQNGGEKGVISGETLAWLFKLVVIEGQTVSEPDITLLYTDSTQQGFKTSALLSLINPLLQCS